MSIIRWMVAITIGVTFSFTNKFYVLAAPKQQAEPPLEITISTAQAEVTVGAPMTWRVTLTPHGQQGIGHVELRPGDTRAWAWPDGAQTVEALISTAVLDVSAVPLISGDLRPILEARYTVGEEMRMQLVVGDVPVHAKSVEARVAAEIIARQRTVRKGERLPVELWIRNGSPFTLTQVQVRGSGTDLAWGAPATVEDVPLGETRRQVLTPTVEGQHPQPQLSIEYTWTDGMDASHTQLLYVSGETVMLEEGVVESTFGRIPNEVFGIIFGLVAGALTGFVGDWVSRTLQKRVNKRHMISLLRMIVMRAKYAANNGVGVDLTPLETIFTQEGLYTIAVKNELGKNIRDLWRVAQRHNNGLNQPGGAQRSEELHKAARKLGKKLDVLRAGEATQTAAP